jgi:hypothetical protein
MVNMSTVPMVACAACECTLTAHPLKDIKVCPGPYEATDKHLGEVVPGCIKMISTSHYDFICKEAKGVHEVSLTRAASAGAGAGAGASSVSTTTTSSPARKRARDFTL